MKVADVCADGQLFTWSFDLILSFGTQMYARQMMNNYLTTHFKRPRSVCHEHLVVVSWALNRVIISSLWVRVSLGAHVKTIRGLLEGGQMYFYSPVFAKRLIGLKIS